MKHIAASIMICMFIAISSVSTDTQSNPTRKVVRIGLMHTFSMADPKCYDPYGKGLLNAVNMAWDDYRRNRDAGSIDVEFLMYDYKDDKILAAHAMKQAALDGITVAIGYVCSDFAIMGGRVAQHVGIPLISPTATADAVANIGDSVFMTSFKDSYQGEVLSSYSFDDLGKRKTLMIVAVDCSYCTSLAKEYRRNFEKLGGRISGEIRILAADNEFADIVSKVRNYDYDSIFIPNHALQSAAIIGSLMEHGIYTLYLGGDGWSWADKTFEIIGNDAFEGYMVTSWMTDVPSTRSRKFVRDYQQRYKEAPLDVAAHSYDSAMMLFESIERSKTYDRRGINEALNKIGSYVGVTGTLEYHGRRSPKKEVIIVQLKNGKATMKAIKRPK